MFDPRFFAFDVPVVRRTEGESVETTILSEKIQIERKLFFFDLKENPRGRFLRITEDVSGRRDTIIVPSTGLENFRDVLTRAIAAAAQAPQAPQMPAGDPMSR